jgi:hypothetical protein
MKSGSSAFMRSGSQMAGWASAASCHQMSRPSCMATAVPVLRTTSTFLMEGQDFSASSALAFSGTLRPPRRPSSAVSRIEHSESWMRLDRLSGENPPKTMEWMAPMRAQASMATAASTIMGR